MLSCLACNASLDPERLSGSRMNLPLLRQACNSIPNWWNINVQDLQSLAHAILGHRNEGWVRKAHDFSIIAKIKFGAEGSTLAKELWSLSSITQSIKGAVEGGSPIKAVAFYHVRFENIHPLHDGNGRVGRIIMAGQLSRAGVIDPAMFEQQLVRLQKQYREAFAASTSFETFSLLLILLGKLTAVQIANPSLDPSLSLQPLHVTPGMPTRSA